MHKQNHSDTFSLHPPSLHPPFPVANQPRCTSTSCGVDARCTETPGAISCSCNAGYTGAATSGCTDINECSTSGKCAGNAVCTNTAGSFTCACSPGYVGDGYSTCSSVCQVTYACVSPAACSIGDKGAAVCTCPVGYTYDKQCLDVDECSSDWAVKACGTAKCSNTAGSFSCVCPAGFAPSNGDCIDVDECKAGTATCAKNTDFVNNVGGYNCTCSAGYVDNKGSCTGERMACWHTWT